MKAMNFWRTLFFSALAVAAFTGCKDDDDDVNGGSEGLAKITVNGKAAVQEAVKDEGETVEVKVVSSGDWTLAFDDETQTWLEVSAKSGSSGESTVTFTVKEALPEAETQRTVKAELKTRGVVLGTEHWARATVIITQSESGNVGGETVLIYKETFGTNAEVANTFVDQYTDWTKTGEGAADVTYVGTNVSVRKTSPNVSTSYAGASGAPILFFGGVPAVFTVQDIALTAEQTNLQLTFGGQQTITYGSDYTWDNANLLVALSGDGETWSTIEYTTNGGDQNADAKNWVLATADFTLKVPSDKLYIRFTSPKLASNLRIDDITLQTGLGGQIVDLAEGDPIPEPTSATISEITEAGDYKVENATVIAAYAAGFLIQDATGIMLVYPGSEATIPAVGKIVTVEGAVTLYGGVLQFGNGTTITETGEGEVPATPEPTEITSENIAGLMTSPSITYVKMTGNFAISGNYRNLTFTTFETNYKGSIVAPAVEGSLDAYNGKLVDITGWFLNNSNGTTYLSILVTNIEENQTEVVVSFTSAPTTFAAENPEEQTINFTAQNLPEGTQVAFDFAGDNADKFTVVGQTETTVTIKAVGNNTDEVAYTAKLTASVNDEVLDEVAVKQAAPDLGNTTKGTYTSMSIFVSSDVSLTVNGASASGFKLGTSSKVGTFTSGALGVTGTKKLGFYAVGWKGKTNVPFKVTVNEGGSASVTTFSLDGNDGAANNSPFTMTDVTDDDYFITELSDLTEASTITFETTDKNNGRAIVFGVQLFD